MICIFCIMVCVAALFFVKYEVQKLAYRLQEIEREISKKQEAIHVLKAEFAYLSKPNSIKLLANKYLNLKLISPEQVISIK